MGAQVSSRAFSTWSKLRRWTLHHVIPNGTRCKRRPLLACSRSLEHSMHEIRSTVKVAQVNATLKPIIIRCTWLFHRSNGFYTGQESHQKYAHGVSNACYGNCSTLFRLRYNLCVSIPHTSILQKNKLETQQRENMPETQIMGAKEKKSEIAYNDTGVVEETINEIHFVKVMAVPKPMPTSYRVHKTRVRMCVALATET